MASPVTKQPAADKAPARSAPPPPTSAAKKGGKKSRRGCLFTVLLLIVLGVVLAIIVRYPQPLEKLTGWRISQWTPQWSSSAEKEDNRAEIEINRRLSSLEKRLQQMSEQLHQVNDAATVASDRSIRSEQQALRLASEVASLTSFRQKPTDSADSHIQIIDLALRLTGDTASAAASLRQIATTRATGEEAAILLDEAARLDRVVGRDQMLRTLRTMYQTSIEDQAAASTVALPTGQDDSILARLQLLLNVRQVSPQSSSLSMDGLLMRLELLLLTGQYVEYWRLLQQIEVASNDNIRSGLRKLKRYGIPDYQLILL